MSPFSTLWNPRRAHGNPDLQLVSQKHRWQPELVAGAWSGNDLMGLNSLWGLINARQSLSELFNVRKKHTFGVRSVWIEEFSFRHLHKSRSQTVWRLLNTRKFWGKLLWLRFVDSGKLLISMSCKERHQSLSSPYPFLKSCSEIYSTKKRE